MIEITRDDAQTVIAVIDYMERTQLIHRAIFENLASAGLVTDPVPRPPHPEAVEAVHHLRDKLQALILATTETAEKVDRYLRLDLLRAVREPHTFDELELDLGWPAAELDRHLLVLETREHIRQLQDGRGNHTFEITPAGEAQL